MSGKLTECKSCKKEVSITAKTCPHCGQKNPGVGYLAIIVIAIIFSIFISSGEDSVSTSEKDISNTQETTQKWYEGGTLYNENALVWQEASQKNKLATSADFVAAMWNKKILKPAILKKINSVDDIKPLAQELVIALDDAFKKDEDEKKNKQLFTNQKVSDTVVILAIIMGWL